MKRITKIIITAALLGSLNGTVFAADIPMESAPSGVTRESVAVTENLISGILDEVQNGLGFADAYGKANNIIYKAVMDGQADGNGYAVLIGIARNAIGTYRDIYLRPEFYQAAENEVQPLIADLVTAVESGTMQYTEAKKEAYIRILQAKDNSFNPAVDMQGDFCYWDVPSVDSAYFNRARKLLLDAETSRAGK